MRHPKLIWNRTGLLAAALFLLCAAVCMVSAEELREDEKGTCVVSGNGYICRLEDGKVHKKAALHFFDRVRVGNATFSGWYYHDADGIYHPGDVRLLELPGQKGTIHAVGNLGKVTAAPQIRFLEETPEGTGLAPGYYFFDETGKLVQEQGVHYLDQTENGRSFHGCYFFGEGGRLAEEEGVTPSGLPYGPDGKVSDTGTPGFEIMEQQLGELLAGDTNTWSI